MHHRACGTHSVLLSRLFQLLDGTGDYLGYHNGSASKLQGLTSYPFPVVEVSVQSAVRQVSAELWVQTSGRGTLRSSGGHQAEHT